MKFPVGLRGVGMLYAWRGPKVTYRIETRESHLPSDTVVQLAIDVPALRATVDREVRKLRQQ